MLVKDNLKLLKAVHLCLAAVGGVPKDQQAGRQVEHMEAVVLVGAVLVALTELAALVRRAWLSLNGDVHEPELLSN